MSRGVQRPQREGTRRGRAGQGPALSHALVGFEALGGAEADDGRPGRTTQGGGARRVVDVGMGHQDGPHRSQRGRGGHDGVGVGLVGRARVHHDGVGLPDEVGVGARAGHETRVGSGEPAQAGRQLVDPSRQRGGPDAEVGHRRDHGLSGRGPGARVGAVLVRLHGDRAHRLVEVAQRLAVAGVGDRRLLVTGVAREHDAHAVPVRDHPGLNGGDRARGPLRRLEELGAGGEPPDGLKVADGGEDDLDLTGPVAGQGILGRRSTPLRSSRRRRARRSGPAVRQPRRSGCRSGGAHRVG